MRPLENGSSADGEILVALVAAVEAYALARRDVLGSSADWAAHAVWPHARLEIDASRLPVGEHLEKLKGADCNPIHVQIPFRCPTSRRTAIRDSMNVRFLWCR